MMFPPDPIYIFKGEMDAVSCLSFRITPHLKHIVAGTQAGKVHVWNLKTKREMGNFTAAEDTCLSVIVPEEEGTIITQNKTGFIKFWKEKGSEWTLLTEIKTDFFGFCKCVIFDEVVYTSLKDCHCQLISVKDRKPLTKLNLGDGTNLGEIMAIRVKEMSGAKVILVAYEAHKLILWNAEKGSKLSELLVDECPMAVDLDAKTRKGICGNPTDKFLVFSLDEELRMKVTKEVPLKNAGVASAAIRADGKVVAVGCWDGCLRLFSWKTLVLLAVLDTHSATLSDVSFAREYSESEKSRYLLAAASQDSRVSLWDLYN